MAGTDSSSSSQSRVRATTSGSLFALLSGAILIGLATVLLAWLGSSDLGLKDDVKLLMMLVVGTAVFLLLIGILVVIFGRLGLATPGQALGMPEGSVRAILALLLILLFFISAIFFATNLTTGTTTRHLANLTAAQLALIPASEIKSQTLVTTTTTTSTTTVPPSGGGGGAGAVVTEPGPLYDVVLFVPADADSRDLAKQVVTAGATLVAAIAAFYFGASTVQQATGSGGGTTNGDQPRGDATQGGSSGGGTNQDADEELSPADEPELVTGH